MSANTRFTGWHAFRWGFWFRIRGYGAAVGWGEPKLFSERNGYRRTYRIINDKLSFRWLKP